MAKSKSTKHTDTKLAAPRAGSPSFHFPPSKKRDVLPFKITFDRGLIEREHADYLERYRDRPGERDTIEMSVNNAIAEFHCQMNEVGFELVSEDGARDGNPPWAIHFTGNAAKMLLGMCVECDQPAAFGCKC